MKIFRAAWVLCLLLVSTVRGYGPAGHEIVGAIADELLAHKSAARQVSALIDGISLERASVIADEIKAWDKNGPDDPNAFPRYSEHVAIDQQLRDFWRANPPTQDSNSSTPSHHWFHYTDVPIVAGEKYAGGKVGRSQWDIVHMIPYCVRVLRGETSDNNDRKITKPVAIILVAHYLGDIHQPLHVGAEYFDQSGHEIDPDKTTSALPDEGGNTFRLHLADDPAPHRGFHYKKFHGFWDLDAVNTLLPALTSTMPKDEQQKQTAAAIHKLAHEMAASEPKNWRLAASVDLNKYAEAWADEILPIAREAHERLQFSGVHPEVDQNHTVAAGDVTEKPESDHLLYRQWASNVVREELQKAGWRLADLLEKSMKPSSPQAAATPPPAFASATVSQPGLSPSLTPSSGSLYGDYPVNYKEIVTAWIKQNGRGSITIDWQTEPKPTDLPSYKGQHRYGYLVIFNASAAGELAKTRSVLIRNGEVVTASGF